MPQKSSWHERQRTHPSGLVFDIGLRVWRRFNCRKLLVISLTVPASPSTLLDSLHFLLILLLLGVYIEYFDDKFLNEYGFVHEQHLLPIQEQYYPKKPARKFLNALESAKVEHALVNQIVEVLLLAISLSAFSC